MKVALVHDWLTGMRGGEKILEGLCELFPEAELYALLYNPSRISGKISRRPIHTSFLQAIPGIYKHYRYWLPFFPKAIEQFDFKEYELVISISHCVAKGIKRPPSVCHICYCLTPMRYAWGFHGEYFGHWPAMTKKIINLILRKLRRWDLQSSNRVNFFLSISENIAQKIRKIYGRKVSQVIFPPVDTKFFAPLKKAGNETGAARLHRDFFLVVSALVPYKRIDLAVESFNRLNLPLVIIGEGPERAGLEKLAGANIKFLGWQSRDKIRQCYCDAQALIFPGEEDFGIVPLEAMACGCPVIAYRKGGVKETVLDGKTGLFFDRPQVESLIAAIERFQKLSFDSVLLRKQAVKFERSVHLEKLKNCILELYQDFKGEKVA